MGSYVHVNMATKIYVKKENGRYRKEIINYNLACQLLKESFNLDLYDSQETDEMIVFCLKNHIIEEYLYDFLREQSYYLMCGEEIRKELEMIRNRDAESILQMLRECALEYIHYVDYDMMSPSYLVNDLSICIESINYLSDGKIIMECYEEFFKYISHLIRLSFHNPLKDTTYIDII